MQAELRLLGSCSKIDHSLKYLTAASALSVIKPDADQRQLTPNPGRNLRRRLHRYFKIKIPENEILVMLRRLW